MGLAAHSLGTETSMFLALLEPRVKAVSHNDFMSDNEQRIISCFPPEEFMFGGHIHIVPVSYTHLYCVESDDFGLTYHRFTMEDYRKLL